MKIISRPMRAARGDFGPHTAKKSRPDKSVIPDRKKIKGSGRAQCRANRRRELAEVAEETQEKKKGKPARPEARSKNS